MKTKLNLQTAVLVILAPFGDGLLFLILVSSHMVVSLTKSKGGFFCSVKHFKKQWSSYLHIDPIRRTFFNYIVEPSVCRLQSSFWYVCVILN